MRTLLSLLWRERSGATAIEYALIVLLIGLVLISLQNSIGASVRQFYFDMAAGL